MYKIHEKIYGDGRKEYEVWPHMKLSLDREKTEETYPFGAYPSYTTIYLQSAKNWINEIEQFNKRHQVVSDKVVWP